jgi:TRAP-type C4-dicarboxylate transport system permease small subunit
MSRAFFHDSLISRSEARTRSSGIGRLAPRATRVFRKVLRSMLNLLFSGFAVVAGAASWNQMPPARQVGQPFNSVRTVIPLSAILPS